ncbi:ATP-binding cassette domain-containing protein [Mycoplasma sp. Pen4]|uniref:ATP-binding cassette domain-containing protein n=1 Tax=Mycoplasma sp. Pen4 TaxID=640330 RepID=UPI00165438BB|nr:ATP-binding cassette domain-containing protein [Mycoplasma sp. Pen4]QNM93447.1 ATP-binding cassette domain-containing protein [Mycoplasma sp. Pen4]
MQKNNEKKTILEIINLKKYFTGRNSVNKAVDDVSFTVKEGEIVGLIGESGSGKTTVGRSLLRLYEDFNGFVRLDGRIISGKKISRKRRKFMRKNIQMIFQDPMAALNGQNTIYSILKEPLVVNGIIKEKKRDIKKDWTKVKNNFKYTFLEKSLTLKLENLRISNKLYKPFVEKWDKNAYDITFGNEGNIDDEFNKYFSYLEEKTRINTIVINNLYKNSEKLINLYEQKQQDFRNKNIDLDEVELENARNNYKHQKRLFFFTQEYFDAKEASANNKLQFKEDYSNYHDKLMISKTSIKNFKSEIYNEFKMHKNDARSTYYLDFYFHETKLKYLNKYLYRLISKNIRRLYFLDFEDLKQLGDEFRAYSQNFYKQELNFELKSKADIKKVKTIVDEKFSFDLTKYIQKSDELKFELADKLKKSRKRYFKGAFKVFNEFFKLAPDYHEERVKAKNEFKKAQKNFDIEAEKYIIEYQKRIESINEKINQELEEQKRLQAIDAKLMIHFKENNSKFNQYYKNTFIAQAKTPDKLKQAKIDGKVFQTNVHDRLNGIKSFQIELKYLNKNLHNIYLLLGISKFDLFISKAPKKLANFISGLTIPFRMKRIGELYTQAKIYKSLEDVGLLKQFAYRYPHEFSGGQRQRIVIARALISEPKVIVADEPIASLDISIQAQVVNLLKDLCKTNNIGMVFIAHDLSMIEYVADSVQIMHLGKIVESGKTEAIYANPVHPYTLNLFKAIPKISNANEKFQDVKFELSYLEEQAFPNVSNIYEIEDGIHYIYGTEAQRDKWIQNLKNKE